MRPELSMMDLQPIRTSTPGTSPTLAIENPAAVQSIDCVYQPQECNPFRPMLCFGHQIFSFERAQVDKAFLARQRADFVAGQHFCLSSGQSFSPDCSVIGGSPRDSRASGCGAEWLRLGPGQLGAWKEGRSIRRARQFPRIPVRNAAKRRNCAGCRSEIRGWVDKDPF